MSIEVRRVSKSFGGYHALKDVSLNINDGELVALLGPSGSGKTTLLRIIAGLEQADDDGLGEVYFHGENVAMHSVSNRRVGFVFQHYALFKHMSVFENIAFGLRVRPRKLRPSKPQISDRVKELLRLIQLEGMGNRYPSQLSGGQRQRVALARALAIQPRVLLLDEPFGALDAKVRQGLRDWLRRLHDELHMTTILVTHDQEEALEVADRVVVMNQARIEQVATPAELFHHPASEFVMDFLGKVNVFQGRLEQGSIEIPGMSVPTSEHSGRTHDAVKVYVRPHELEILRESDGSPCINAKILRINPAGAIAKIAVESELGESMQIDMTLDRLNELGLEPGETIWVSARNARVFVPGGIASLEPTVKESR